MSDDFTFRLIMGHLVGDYLLQTNWMALNKKTQLRPAAAHCLIYTACVWAFIFPEYWSVGVPWKAGLLVGLIYVSHHILDASNLVENWLNLIGSRSFQNTASYCSQNAGNPAAQAYARAYTAIVQTVADNTLHLISMYFIVKGLMA